MTSKLPPNNRGNRPKDIDMWAKRTSAPPLTSSYAVIGQERIDRYAVRTSSTPPTALTSSPIVSPRPGSDRPYRLFPADLVDSVRETSRFQFVNTYGDTFFLAIRVEPDGELLTELVNAAVNEREGRFSILPDPHEPTLRRSLGDTGQEIARPTFGSYDMVQHLAKGRSFFFAPVRKRKSQTRASARISVGRTRNSDLVLRDPTISGFHAWFEFDERGRCLLADARSTNKTWLNGRTLDPLALERLRAGDQIRFANVEIVVCPADVLWEVLQNRSFRR